MRTTAEENDRMGRWIGERLNRMDGPVRFFLPEGGVSALDAPGRPFWDPEADMACFDAIKATFQSGKIDAGATLNVGGHSAASRTPSRPLVPAPM